LEVSNVRKGEASEENSRALILLMTSTLHLAVGMLAAKEGMEGKEGRRFTAFGLIE